ncbi:Glycine cleavage system transcriptional activator [Pigmentiphaga humi]|uniref:Glycine cleavage system transcriptional activator n=1 Tax=Pigmentiphaga humi TaxID=2478468 RepID=A0A3P4B169_9BURK|nr:transcriptional regulator GcvA [Pigmentiphaga humi]VCU69398.1 Glycine cleavage system transcriptional activator [Pigmentiphaga humi]
MSYRLPPLYPLRTFEAAARLRSFSRAARELHVTPGAVSRQVLALEEFLGARLFERANREVRLTPVGQRYLDDLGDVFERMAGATRRAMRGSDDQPLHIWCPMTFAMRWLLPRLPAFHAAHPGQDAVFTTALKPVDFDTHDADVAIRMGEGDWPGVMSTFLVGIELLPVCSPRLLENGPPLAAPADLARHTLLQSVARPDYWRRWLEAAGTRGIDPDRGLTFESVSLAYQAALEGIGVAMGQHALVADDLAAGRLVAPLEPRVPIDNAFYLVYPERRAQDARVAVFRDWIVAAAQAGQRDAGAR